MHAYLIIGDKDKENKIKEIVGDNDSEVINIELQKINDVRELQSITKYQDVSEKYYVLNNFENATIEAMNAFLKLLEEPNENINFILCATEQKNILDTIISRCKIIRIGHETNSEVAKFTKMFLSSDNSQKLKKLHSLNNKDDALIFLSDLIEGGHALLINNKNDSKKLLNIIESSIKAKKEITSNANVTSALTKLTLDLVRD
jgi:DNA polymerase III delta prime subunit